MLITSLTPNLMVEDVHRSADFWCGLMGFTVPCCVDSQHRMYSERRPEADLVWAQFVCGAVELMVQRRDNICLDVPLFAGQPTGATATFYLQVDDLDALHRRIGHLAPTVKEPLTQPYGMKEWYVLDPDGYVVCLAQNVAKG